jgi:heat shock protein HslJ
MRRMILFLTSFLALAAAGCVAQAGPGHVLGGSEWRFLSIDGETAASKTARLKFEDERLGANVGCNGIGGPWRVENGRLFAGPLAQTEMYCAGPVWEQEQSTSALLVAAPEIALDGDRMMLRSRGHVAELERINPPPQEQ